MLGRLLKKIDKRALTGESASEYETFQSPR